MAKRLHSQSAYIGPGSICARMYSFGRYPGIMLSEAARNRVHGEVVRLMNPGRSLRWIDAYEGCGPDDLEPLEYNRVIVPVQLTSGGMLEAWVYAYAGSIAYARHIPAGRFHPQ